MKIPLYHQTGNLVSFQTVNPTSTLRTMGHVPDASHTLQLQKTDWNVKFQSVAKTKWSLLKEPVNIACHIKLLLRIKCNVLNQLVNNVKRSLLGVCVKLVSHTKSKLSIRNHVSTLNVLIMNSSLRMLNVNHAKNSLLSPETENHASSHPVSVENTSLKMELVRFAHHILCQLKTKWIVKHKSVRIQEIQLVQMVNAMPMMKLWRRDMKHSRVRLNCAPTLLNRWVKKLRNSWANFRRRLKKVTNLLTNSQVRRNSLNNSRIKEITLAKNSIRTNKNWLKFNVNLTWNNNQRCRSLNNCKRNKVWLSNAKDPRTSSKTILWWLSLLRLSFRSKQYLAKRTLIITGWKLLNQTMLFLLNVMLLSNSLRGRELRLNNKKEPSLEIARCKSMMKRKKQVFLKRDMEMLRWNSQKC